MSTVETHETAPTQLIEANGPSGRSLRTFA
jgi:hypothetical protein